MDPVWWVVVALLALLPLAGSAGWHVGHEMGVEEEERRGRADV